MYTIKKIGAVCIMLLFYALGAIAQHPLPGQPESQIKVTDVLPPAPNAFELTRYSGLPVNESSGSVSVTIPLGTLKAGSIGVPINLSYNSGNGVLVNQIASRTGIGWVLNAGGVITRTVYNNPDESNTWLTPSPDMFGQTSATYDYIYNATLGNSGTDTQVDIFSFNFNGYNGQFYLDPTDKTKIVMIDASNLKVVNNMDHHIAEDWSFMVTDAKGVRYYFGGTSATEKSLTKQTGSFSNCGKNFQSPTENAWYLTSIQHYAGETITFTYAAIPQYEYYTDVLETIFASQGSVKQYCTPPQTCQTPPAPSVCFSDLLTTGVMLSSINSPFESITINYTSRQDLPGDNLVSQVNFLKRNTPDSTPSIYETYSLGYTTASNSTYHNDCPDFHVIYRPFLMIVTRQGTGMQSETHTMTYNNINGLPSRLSYAQDYWGYANGVNNLHFVPPSGNPTIDALFPSGLANRAPNSSYSSAGLLTGITYPTQGSDVIAYEPNTVYSPSLGNYQVGGVRVHQNVSSPVTGNPLTKTYIYAALDNQSQSSGHLRASADPINYYSTSSVGGDCGHGDGTIGICEYYLGTSRPFWQLNYYSGGHICYDHVIVLRDATWANGGVEYQYEAASSGQDAIQCNSPGHIIPGAPITNYAFPPGIEKLRRTFTTTGSTNTIVNSVATHNVLNELRHQDNYVVRRNWIPLGSPASVNSFLAFDWMTYKVMSNWIYADQVTTTNYDLAGANPVTVVKNYVYGNPATLLLTETSATGSDGLIEKTDYKYPYDFTGTAPYDGMVAANDIDHVIEQLSYKNGNLLEGVRTDYSDFGSGVFKPSVINSKTTGSYEPRINFYGYNSSGGLTSQSKVNGPASSYLWAYSSLLPVAEVKNAAANEIFYENFEFVTGTSVSATAHTGKQAWAASYTVPFTPPAGKTYVVSWFQQNGAKWDYHLETYTGSKTITGAVIDDVSVYPADAQMSMIAYDPVAGPVGMIDAKGETTTYIYDTFNRLTDIKDKDGNIVKHIDYHYSTGSL